jgi:hypothetical protein
VIKITDALIDRIISDPISVRDPFYEEAVKIDDGIADTFGDDYPEFMSLQRPNETKSQVKYRKDYFESTGNPISPCLAQIQNQVDKVFTSDEFKIVYNHETKLGDDSLEKYLEEGYYNGNRFIDSFRHAIRKAVITQPNAVLSVIPNAQAQEYAKPYFLISSADKVLYYKANEFCLLESKLTSEMTDADGNILGYGKILYLFDTEYYCVLKEIGIGDDGNPIWSKNKVGENFRRHGYNGLPCKKLGSKIKESTEDGHELRVSDVSDSLVFLRNAVMNFMDLIVEHNFHVASQEWVLGTTDCTSCRGTGKVKGEGKATDCKTCGASGKVPSFTGDGLNKMVIPMGMNELGKSDKMPNIFGGYIERPETGSKIFKESCDRNMQLALRPFGLENLLDVPYNQSGRSKSYDMQEGYSFIRSMALHIGSILKMTIEAIAYNRYKGIPREDLNKEIPQLVIPKSFNLSNVYTIFEKIKEASTYHLPDSVKLNYTLQLIETENGKNSREALEYKVRSSIDPLPASNYSEKLLSRGVLGDLRYILSVNIHSIMNRAIIENRGFLTMEYRDQIAICNAYAQEILDDAQENLDKEITIERQANIIEAASTNTI